MYTVAHLSDIHLPTPPLPGIGALLNKRLLGYLSWRLRRSRIHRPEVLDVLRRDLLAQSPDHIALTGDLVNISLPAEFQRAAEWLPKLGPPDRVTVIPGNHDAYVAMPWARSWSLWAPYMASETVEGDVVIPRDFTDFPLVRRRGPVAIIGLSSAAPTGPGLATGKLGSRQIKALAGLLGELDQEDLFRIVLIHHPPLADVARARKSLVDAESFRRAIEAVGAELVLHGHDHRFGFGELKGPDGPVAIVGAASASALVGSLHTPPGHYHLFDIERTDGGWTMGMRTRGFDPAFGQFGDIDFRRVEFHR